MEGSLPLPVNPLVALLTLRRTDILSGVHGSLLGNIDCEGMKTAPMSEAQIPRRIFLLSCFIFFPPLRRGATISLSQFKGACLFVAPLQ
jgi:hypothetical protein